MVESHLRLIIFIVGIIIVAAICYDGFRRKKRRQHTLQPELGRMDRMPDIDEGPSLGVLAEPLTSTTATPAPANSPSREYQAPAAEVKEVVAEPQPEPQLEAPYDSQMIALYTVADNAQPYSGYELLQVLLSAEMRYGQMSIFHRHSNADGQGDILFSLANVQEPGTFDMNNIGAFSSPALVFILETKQGQDNQAAFKLMVETAQQLVEELGGQLLSDDKQTLTAESQQRIAASIVD